LRLQPHEVRDIREKILDGIDKGKTINDIKKELTKISSSTIYKLADGLEDAGSIEEL
jgi:predicted AAA+ superfamily ATPase